MTEIWANVFFCPKLHYGEYYGIIFFGHWDRTLKEIRGRNGQFYAKSDQRIVEDCGINRNSFYYHFQDIPTLLEEIITEQAEELIETYPEIESLEKGLEVAIEFAIKNKNAVLHIYNSVNRDMYEQYTMRLCRHVVTKYLAVAFKEQLSAEDETIAVRIISCASISVCAVHLSNSGGRRSTTFVSISDMSSSAASRAFPRFFSTDASSRLISRL